jgi:nitrate reductase delta subunit
VAEEINVWSVLAQVVDYPAPNLGAALGTLVEACSAALPEAAAEFQKFRDEFDHQGMVRIEELYTAAFDFETDSSPYVGFHLFGEDPRRSLFMARLKERYREHGIEPGVELPDHLASVLRLLAAAPEGEEADEIVADCLLPAIEKMRAGLEGKNSPYERLLRGASMVIEERAKSASGLGDATCRPFSLSSFRTSR